MLQFSPLNLTIRPSNKLLLILAVMMGLVYLSLSLLALDWLALMSLVLLITAQFYQLWRQYISLQSDHAICFLGFDADLNWQLGTRAQGRFKVKLSPHAQTYPNSAWLLFIDEHNKKHLLILNKDQIDKQAFRLLYINLRLLAFQN